MYGDRFHTLTGVTYPSFLQSSREGRPLILRSSVARVIVCASGVHVAGGDER